MQTPRLPRRSPRSDDLERGEPGPPLHPITGTFADATHAKDFAARCFRLAFHLHALVLAVFVVADTYYFSVCTAPSITCFANLLVDGTLLLLRIGLHRSSDHSRAQQLGSAAWTLYVVAFPLAIGVLDPGYFAGQLPGMGPGAMIVFGFGLALVNSSHGLSFAHKTTLALVLMLTPPVVSALVLHPVAHFFNPVAAVTRATVDMTLNVTVLYCWSFAAGHVCAHVMERLAARLYLTHEQLQESYQRLHYDLQNPARPRDDRRRVARGLLATRHPGARDAPSASASSGPASTSTSSSSRRVSFAAPGPPAAAPPSDGAAVAGSSQGAGAAPALLHEAAPAAAGSSTTDPSEAEGAARSDSLPTLPPGPPSSASSGSLARSGVGPEWHAETQRHAEAVAEPTAKTYPTWAELDAQFYAEQRAAESAAMLPAANSSAAGSVGRPPIPPPSWAELAYRRFYAERAARAPAESGGAPPMGQPPTLAELEALRAVGLAADEQGAVQGGSAAEQEADVVAAARALTDLGQP